jgi:transcriptional regulator with XRE-family HTH domain
MFDTAKFGALVATLRKGADMTQSELADRLGLTRQAISRYECGDSFPDISILREMASIFNISVELLISSGNPTEGEAQILNAVASGNEVKQANAADVAT